MKITKIEIKDFHQFNGLTIDLTYPKGHKKEGIPLDKICFIGQSGTGKTTLLELIPKFLYHYDTNLIIKSGIEAILKKIQFFIQFGIQKSYSSSIIYDKKNENGQIIFGRQWKDKMVNREKVEGNLSSNYYINEWQKKNCY